MRARVVRRGITNKNGAQFCQRGYFRAGKICGLKFPSARRDSRQLLPLVIARFCVSPRKVPARARRTEAIAAHGESLFRPQIVVCKCAE